MEEKKLTTRTTIKKLNETEFNNKNIDEKLSKIKSLGSLRSTSRATRNKEDLEMLFDIKKLETHLNEYGNVPEHKMIFHDSRNQKYILYLKSNGVKNPEKVRKYDNKLRFLVARDADGEDFIKPYLVTGYLISEVIKQLPIFLDELHNAMINENRLTI